VRASDSQTLSTPATCFQCDAYGRRTGLKIRHAPGSPGVDCFHRHRGRAAISFGNFTRMAHARLLYDYLETEKAERRMDDVLAEDYGYPAQAIELPADDRLRLNKDLLHFSYKRLRHSPESKPWPNSILGNLFDPVLGFMTHIRDNRPDLFDSIEERMNWSRLHGLLETGRELRIRVSADVDYRPRYDFHLGLRLPSGKPVLTHFVPSSVSVPPPCTGTTCQ
jgi:hypothetical protein